MKRILLTVTNDLSYDQRMQRIAGTLAGNGYEVLLIGRKRRASVVLLEKPYGQKRLGCFFEKGFLFYAEYNIRLLLFLLFRRADIICAIDLDTILPVYLASVCKGCTRVYDAHELFTEQKEVITRPGVQRFWLAVERFAVPRFTRGYTVNHFIVSELKRRYGVEYGLIRNLPRITSLPVRPKTSGRWILYQGAVNEGRCFETLIPAMREVKAPLVVCGDGNFFEQAKALAKQYGVEDKIRFRGYVRPEELVNITPDAYIGLTLFEAEGLNQYQSLANRFFDYIMAGVPQVCVDYPEYAAIRKTYQVMYPVNTTDSETLARALNNLLADDVLYQELRSNCLRARSVLNWENESNSLLDFYRDL